MFVLEWERECTFRQAHKQGTERNRGVGRGTSRLGAELRTLLGSLMTLGSWPEPNPRFGCLTSWTIQASYSHILELIHEFPQNILWDFDWGLHWMPRNIWGKCNLITVFDFPITDYHKSLCLFRLYYFFLIPFYYFLWKAIFWSFL